LSPPWRCIRAKGGRRQRTTLCHWWTKWRWLGRCGALPPRRLRVSNRSARARIGRESVCFLLCTTPMCAHAHTTLGHGHSHDDVLSCCNALVLADRWCMNVSRTGQWGVPSSGHTLASIDDIHIAIASNGQPDDHRLLLHFLYITLTGWRALAICWRLGENLFPWLALPGLAQVTTDWVRVASAARRIPIRAIVPVKGVSPPDPSWPPDYPSSEVCGRVAFIHFGMVCPFKSTVLIAYTAYPFLRDHRRRPITASLRPCQQRRFSTKCPKARVAKSVSSSRVQF